MEGVPMDKEAIGESNKLKDKLASSMLAIEKKHVRLPVASMFECNARCQEIGGFSVPVKAVNDCMMNCGKPVGAVKDVIADEMNRFRAFLGRKIEKCSKQAETLPEEVREFEFSRCAELQFQVQQALLPDFEEKVADRVKNMKS